jgi:hypothetical protein
MMLIVRLLAAEKRGTNPALSEFVFCELRRCPMADSETLSRHRDKDGELSRKHGNTLVGTLRKTYGTHFARGCSDTQKLSDVLVKLDKHSLSQLIADHQSGRLELICRG